MRASMNGGHASVDMVATTPSLEVAEPIMAASGMGSCFGTCSAYFSVALGVTSVGLGDHQGVFENDVIETGALHRLRHFDEELAVPVAGALGHRVVSSRLG